MAVKQDNFEYPDSLDSITREIFAEADEKLHKKMARYNESIKRCLALNDMNIREKALVASTIHHGFINSLYAEKRELKRYEKALKIKTEEFITKNGLEDTCRVMYNFGFNVKNSVELMKLM